MSLAPPGEELRQALKWIDSERLANPRHSLRGLVEAAALRFNLSPREVEYLLRLLKLTAS